MKKIYYLTRCFVTLPCLGLLPIGLYFLYLNFSDYGMMAQIVCMIVAYVWIVSRYISPNVNPAFIKSATSPLKFLAVNVIVTLIISVMLLLIGTCLWPVLLPIFKWLIKDQIGINSHYEFFWIYCLASSLFHSLYLLIWGYLDERRWIRKLTIRNACW